MRTYLRPFLLIWLVWHLFVMSVDIAKHVSRMMTPNSFQEKLASYADLRTWTKPYQWRVGVHQNWTMFVPNPRMSTSWLVVEGLRRTGETVELPLVIGEPDPNGAIWVYARAGKHERSAVSTHRKRLRMAYTRYYCRLAVEEGKPLRSVSFFVESQRTPRPELRGKLPRSEWRRTRRELGSWKCRK